MSNSESLWNHLGVITHLVELAPNQKIGRTAIVKDLFFLTVLRDVPLDYDFRLHTYGPYDPDIIEDLSYAESLEAVTSKLVVYPNGYGYDVSPGPKAEKIKSKAKDFLNRFEKDIDWVVEEFGDCRVSILELISTLIYVDHEADNRDEKLDIGELGELVRDIKPHFDLDFIIGQAQYLNEKKLLVSIR